MVLASLLKEFPLRLNEAMVNLRYKPHEVDNYVDIDRCQLVIQKHKTSKAVKQKVFKLSGDQLTALVNHREVFDFDFVFIRNRTPYQNVSISETGAQQFWKNMIKTYCKDSGIPYQPYGIHQLRHSFTTQKCSEISIDPAVAEQLFKIKQMMGHKSVDTFLTHYLKTVDVSQKLTVSEKLTDEESDSDNITNSKKTYSADDSAE